MSAYSGKTRSTSVWAKRFHVSGGAEQPLAMPYPEPQLSRLFVGHAGRSGLAGQHQAGNAFGVDAVIAVLADLAACVGVGLDGIEHCALVSASRQFVIETHPVVTRGLHRQEHLCGSAGLAENLVFQYIYAVACVGEGRELGNNFAIWRQGGGGMFAFAYINARPLPGLWRAQSSRVSSVSSYLSFRESYCGREAVDDRGSVVEGYTRLKKYRLIQKPRR